MLGEGSRETNALQRTTPRLFLAPHCTCSSLLPRLLPPCPLQGTVFCAGRMPWGSAEPSYGSLPLDPSGERRATRTPACSFDPAGERSADPAACSSTPKGSAQQRESASGFNPALGSAQQAPLRAARPRRGAHSSSDLRAASTQRGARSRCRACSSTPQGSAQRGPPAGCSTSACSQDQTRGACTLLRHPEAGESMGHASAPLIQVLQDHAKHGLQQLHVPPPPRGAGGLALAPSRRPKGRALGPASARTAWQPFSCRGAACRGAWRAPSSTPPCPPRSRPPTLRRCAFPPQLGTPPPDGRVALPSPPP